MIQEQPAPDSGALFVECPTCGTGASARVDVPVDDVTEAVGRSGAGRRSHRHSRFEIGDTAPVFGVCVECGFGLIVNPALYTLSSRRAA